MKAPGRLARHLPLKPGTGFKPRKQGIRRTGPLPEASAKGRAGRAQQRQAYEQAPTSDFCQVCGQPGEVEHSHLLTQKQYPEHRNNPLNWLLVGKWCDCHRIWENSKAVFAARYPEAWALIQDRILQVGGVQALAFFNLKNPY